MVTVRHLVKFPRRALGAALLAAAPAWVGIAVTTPGAFDDNGFPQPFNGGVFNLNPTSPVIGSGVFSQVRAMEQRRSRLLTGPDRELIFTQELDDTGFLTTLVAGEGVSARASVGPPSPVVGESPARARTSPFANQVRTVTSRQLYIYNGSVVQDNGKPTSRKTSTRRAVARRVPHPSGMTPGPPMSAAAPASRWRSTAASAAPSPAVGTPTA